jgi:hypothetical protein
MTDIVEEIIDEVEEVFKPRPGGMVDRHRQEKARREAALKQDEQADERIEETSYRAIKTTQISPEITSTPSYNLAAGATQMILPLSEYRYRAVISASVSVLLCKDNGSALSGIGFPIPANTPFPVYSRAQLWAAAIGGAVTVSVFAEIYAPEK